MKHDNKPLTVDQMREMHDKVVIVKTLEYGQESKGILDFSDPNDSDNGVYVGCNFYSVEHYGDWWLAYAQKQVDFDDWEPCEHCKPSKYPPDRFGPHDFPVVDNAIFYYDVDDGWEGEEINFCPWCSRPLTDEAKQMLEKRLSGHNNEQ